MRFFRHRRILSRSVLSLLILISLVGCQTIKKRVSSPATVNDLSLESKEKQYQHVNLAISLLEKGKNEKAQKLIIEVLTANPQQQTAKTLNRQLTQTAVDFFKTKGFTTYQVKSGDSLGGIAHTWLGNSLYFVSLAKLNSIKKPALLQPGAKIKIPLTQKSQAIIKEKERSRANLKLLDDYYRDKAFLQGLKKSNSLFIIKAHYKRLEEIQMRLLKGYSESAVSISEKQEMLDKIKALKTTTRSEEQQAQFQLFINKQQTHILLEESTLLFEDKSYLDSAKKLIQAAKLDSDIKKQTQVFRMEKLIVNKLHEEAIVYYRNHSLSKALGHWQLIKQLQPSNKLAEKYINRTKKLLNKLNEY